MLTTAFPTKSQPLIERLPCNYVLGEVIDAMGREQATSRRRPLHQSWQHFVYQLRLKKPKLGTCLDHWLRDGFFDEQEGGQ